MDPVSASHPQGCYSSTTTDKVLIVALVCIGLATAGLAASGWYYLPKPLVLPISIAAASTTVIAILGLVPYCLCSDQSKEESHTHSYAPQWDDHEDHLLGGCSTASVAVEHHPFLPWSPEAEAGFPGHDSDHGSLLHHHHERLTLGTGRVSPLPHRHSPGGYATHTRFSTDRTEMDSPSDASGLWPQGRRSILRPASRLPAPPPSPVSSSSSSSSDKAGDPPEQLHDTMPTVEREKERIEAARHAQTVQAPLAAAQSALPWKTLKIEQCQSAKHQMTFHEIGRVLLKGVKPGSLLRNNHGFGILDIEGGSYVFKQEGPEIKYRFIPHQGALSVHTEDIYVIEQKSDKGYQMVILDAQCGSHKKIELPILEAQRFIRGVQTGEYMVCIANKAKGGNVVYIIPLNQMEREVEILPIDTRFEPIVKAMGFGNTLALVTQNHVYSCDLSSPSKGFSKILHHSNPSHIFTLGTRTFGSYFNNMLGVFIAGRWVQIPIGSSWQTIPNRLFGSQIQQKQTVHQVLGYELFGKQTVVMQVLKQTVTQPTALGRPLSGKVPVPHMQRPQLNQTIEQQSYVIEDGKIRPSLTSFPVEPFVALQDRLLLCDKQGYLKLWAPGHR